MTWTNQRRIFNLEPAEWRSSHVQVPTPYVMKDWIRVYYAGRRNGQSYPAFFDLDFDLKTILRVQTSPIMEMGQPGMFDSDGIMPGCIVDHPAANELWMYYTGWNSRSTGARYHNATLALQ